MSILQKSIQTLVAGVLVVATNAWAASVDITVHDSSSPWNFGSGDSRSGIGEDNETEPGTIQGQEWDMEAFVAKDGKLYVVGGFNYATGVAGYSSFSTGDIFIDGNNNAKWGQNAPSLGGSDGYKTLKNSDYKYDFVIDIESNGTSDSIDYAVYQLDESSTSKDRMKSVYYRSNDEANPWEYLGEKQSGGSIVKSGELVDGTVDVITLSDAEVLALLGISVTGGQHFVIAFDMSWYVAGDSLLTHYTMGCGNDNLIGEMQGGFDVADGGATLFLLGLAVTGLGLIRQRRRAAA